MGEEQVRPNRSVGRYSRPPRGRPREEVKSSPTVAANENGDDDEGTPSGLVFFSMMSFLLTRPALLLFSITNSPLLLLQTQDPPPSEAVSGSSALETLPAVS